MSLVRREGFTPDSTDSSSPETDFLKQSPGSAEWVEVWYFRRLICGFEKQYFFSFIQQCVNLFKMQVHSMFFE